MSFAPLVGVVMPVCDGEKYVEEALKSILGQSFCRRGLPDALPVRGGA